jgi:hypothetical protein
MSRETLLKEKEALQEWIEKIKENNSNEYEDYWMIEHLEEEIKKIDKKIKNE